MELLQNHLSSLTRRTYSCCYICGWEENMRVGGEYTLSHLTCIFIFDIQYEIEISPQ